METSMSTEKMGRPRDTVLRKKILGTAVKLLLSEGYNRTTMKNIALKAGASKQTLYRWWSNRAELLMEAFTDYAERRIAFPETHSDEEDLFEFIHNTFSGIRKETGALLKSLLAESINSSDFADIFYNKFILKRQIYLAHKIKLMSKFKDHDEETINTFVDVIFGTMWYRLLFDHRPLDKKFAQEIASLILRTT
jgi:AcrR family transcriptional regulator